MVVSEAFGEGLYATRPTMLIRHVAHSMAGALRAAWVLIRERRSISAILLTYPSLVETAVLVPLAFVIKRPIITDFYISLFDTFAHDRGIRPPRHPISRALRSIDRWMLRSSTLVITDTPENNQRYAEMFNIPASKMLAVPVGYPPEFDEDLTHPPSRLGPTRVLFYGSFIPLHGAHRFVVASQHPALSNFDFTFIGTGQTRQQSELFVPESSNNIKFVDWLDKPALIKEIDNSHIVLGIAGTSEKAMSVIPNKVYQALARNRIVLTAQSPAIENSLGKAVITFDPANDDSIVSQLLHIRDNYEVSFQEMQAHRVAALLRCSDDTLGATLSARLPSVSP